jgi:hypothetical protein
MTMLTDLIERSPEINRTTKENNYFFNKEECNADYIFWSKQATWSIDEGILLILGKDPRKVYWANIKEYAESSLVKKCIEMRETARRFIEAGQLNNPIPPGEFLTWSEKMGYKTPEQLLNLVNAFGIKIADWQTAYYESINHHLETIQLFMIIQNELDQSRLDYKELLENPHNMDETNPAYAEELDACNIIYRSIINSKNIELSFKKQATTLLQKLYPHFSGEAKERIATVVNNKKGKRGGRTSTT